MSDKLLTLGLEDLRIEPQEVRVDSYSYMKGHPPFLRAGTRGTLLNYGVSAIRGEKIKFFEEPYRPYIFKVDEIVNATPDGLFETTPTSNLRVMAAHASMLANGLWIFADAIPVVEGVRAWNQANPQERVNLVVACQSAQVDPTSVDISLFGPEEDVMSVYAGPANAGFGLTESGKVIGIIKTAQFPDMRSYLARLPTFEV